MQIIALLYIIQQTTGIALQYVFQISMPTSDFALFSLLLNPVIVPRRSLIFHVQVGETWSVHAPVNLDETDPRVHC